MPAKTQKLIAEYQHLFDTCIIKPGKYNAVDSQIEKLNASRALYEKVAIKTGVPWYFIGIIHGLEGGGNFKTHLHNGDPLTNRTVQVPKGHPKSGSPPFKWEDSAVDALLLKKLDKIQNWDIPELLFQLEAYNGFGYRSKGIFSPYLWSFSNHYSEGKYTSDGRYDPEAVSKQIGAGVILRRLAERKLAIIGVIDRWSVLNKLGEEAVFNPKTFNEKAKELQILLSSLGQPLKSDGLAGTLTSDAYFRLTGRYLKKDKRRINPII